MYPALRRSFVKFTQLTRNVRGVREVRRHNSNISRDHHHQPLRRALLYVPGDDERKITKITSLQVDAVILDCEDGVAQNRKDAARHTIAKKLQTITTAGAHTDWGVRVNGVESDHLAADLQALFGNSSATPKTLFLPKVDHVGHLDTFHTLLEECVARDRDHHQPFDLFFYAESCLSLMDLPQLCRHAIELSHKSSSSSSGRQLFRLAGLVFGSDDLVADLGAVRTSSSVEILYARQRFVLIAKAFRLQAIDMVDINLKNLQGLRAICEEGARMGYTGKQVIHPGQVEIVQTSFRPPDAMVVWARELLEAYEVHQKSGKGAFVFRNQMIDAPTMKQAMNIVAMAAA